MLTSESLIEEFVMDRSSPINLSQTEHDKTRQIYKQHRTPRQRTKQCLTQTMKSRNHTIVFRPNLRIEVRNRFFRSQAAANILISKDY